MRKPMVTANQKSSSKKRKSNLLEELYASEVRYRRLFESAKDGILILDAETGKIVDANPFIMELLGYTKHNVIGKSIWEIGAFKDIYENKEKFLELKEKEYVRYDDLPLVTSKGFKIHVEFVSNVYLANNIKVIQCNIRDITNRKKLETELIKEKERAEESDRLKSAFLANMSHEIRTPMNGILGFTELLKNLHLKDDEQQEFIRIIEKSGLRMLNILNDIISISKIESYQIEITVSETNVNEQLEYIYHFFRLEAEHKKLKLTFNNKLPNNKAFVKTDREKVYAVLTNLVKNAIKFTQTGSIELGVQKIDGFFRFYVKDSGPGIPEEQKQIIFERFRQGSETKTRNYEGAGLGLSISKAYVEMLGGKIWAENNEGSNGHSTGATFFFTIPVRSKEPTNNVIKEVLSEESTNNETRKLNVLIVENDKMSEILLIKMVDGLCKNILKATNGVEAVETCRKNRDIDLVLMDINMPEMDGYEATRKIREFNKKVVIIAQTAYALTGDREKAIAAGCNNYISKPIDRGNLRVMVYSYFSEEPDSSDSENDVTNYQSYVNV